MTQEERITAVRTMIGDNEDSDETISLYLEFSKQKILARAYPYDQSVTELSERYHPLQCEIAVFMMNKRGAEGETSHSENGITRNYASADVPSVMLRSVVPHVGVFGGGSDESNEP